ncbi:MAG: sugar ABC transporter permease, partial [Anaerolineales bacterium]|nr:sugar ABC transporter permease [Anaerolineales bacterium]
MRADKDRYLSVVLIAPSILAVLIFIYVFIGWSVRVSLSKWKGLTADYSWNGISTYTNLFSDPRFHVDVRNTLIFTGVFVVGSIILGFILAVLLDQGLKGEGFFRSLFLFPMAISYIVTGVVWRWLMNPAEGDRLSGLNLLFSYFHLDFLI